MDENVTRLQLLLAVAGGLLSSTALHMKKPGKDLAYGFTFGFAQNLTGQGRMLFFLGLALFIGAVFL